MRSLAGHLALVGLPIMALLFAYDAIIAYRDARETVNAAHDRSLRTALVLLHQHPVSPETATDLLAESLSVGADEVYFAFVDHGGNTVAGDGDLPYRRPTADDPFRFHNGYHRGRPVRIGALYVAPGDGAASDSGAFLVVAETTRTRVEAVYHLVRRELLRHLLSAAAAIGLAWAALRNLRRALDRPAAILARREAEDLTSLPTDDVPAEVRPLVDAVNGHLARLAGLFEASRRFAADVAHQLRTPLTLLGAQAQYGLRLDDVAGLRRALEGVSSASRGAQRLCNQMLTLSRIEAVKGAMRDGVRIDLAAMLRETALDLSVLAIEKRIDLAYQDGGEPVYTIGNEIMLHELFSNLIDNALRYTPREGRVAITLKAQEEQAEVTIADSGPGIPPERREAAFQRFHRRLDRSGASGSGLGLAIAHQIALVHRGTIAFDDVEGDCGFLVRVRLPISGAPNGPIPKGS
jgi:two-component system sensor histidine kinase TctE